MTAHHPNCFAEADHGQFNEILTATETTAVVLEMIGCFLENTDKEKWDENAYAIIELARQQSRRLRAVQSHISDLEEKAYQYELMTKDTSNT
ncbi:hypothetical protein [uncultured Roseibium sp.]|uniref:hypothetical protein n=1 Tax=uncultured Roseibium sp. TaxID=1936171 RepID=UPI003216D3FC